MTIEETKFEHLPEGCGSGDLIKVASEVFSAVQVSEQ